MTDVARGPDRRYRRRKVDRGRRRSPRGAIIVDGDVISREVVAVGTDGLAALVDEFGSHILLPDGALIGPRWPPSPSAMTTSGGR